MRASDPWQGEKGGKSGKNKQLDEWVTMKPFMRSICSHMRNGTTLGKYQDEFKTQQASRKKNL